MENTRKIPSQDGRLRCQLSYESNGTNARTMKIKAVARTSEAIEIAGWSSETNPSGRLIHDLSGYRLRKSSIPMLYNHGSTVIGEWTRMELQDGNLVAFGILKSVEDGDLAGSLIKRLDESLPCEASINFGDEMLAEEYGVDETLFVNGREYPTPATVIRQYFIREISLCPLGADPLTSAAVDQTPYADPADAFTFSATIRPRHTLSVTPTPEPQVKPEKPLTEAEAAHLAVIERIRKDANPETPTAPQVQPEPPSPVPSVAAEPKPEPTPTEPPATGGVDVGSGVESSPAPDVSPFVDALRRWADDFGSELAVQWIVEGISEQEAQRRYCDNLKSELAAKTETIKKLSARSPSAAVDFIPSDNQQQQQTDRINELMRKGVSRGQAAFISKNFNK